MVNYVVAGPSPTASARELAEMVQARIPGAKITFQPDRELQKVLNKLLLPLDDRMARKEWRWKPDYNQEQIVDDFLKEMKTYPQRYL